MKITLLIIAVISFTSCATNTGIEAKDRRGRITNAVLEETFMSLLNFGVAEGQQFVTGQKGQNAATAAFNAATNTGGILSSDGLRHIIQASSNPVIAAKAADAFQQANPQTPAETKVVVNTIGAAIQQASNTVSK